MNNFQFKFFRLFENISEMVKRSTIAQKAPDSQRVISTSVDLAV